MPPKVVLKLGASYIERDWERERERERQRERDRQTDRQTDRERGREKESARWKVLEENNFMNSNHQDNGFEK